MVRRRTWRSATAGFVSFAVFCSVVVMATQADGREATRAESNDGGAWLVDRSKGGAAHVEHSSRLASVGLSRWDPRSELSAIQAPGVVAVIDRTSSSVLIVDSANAIERSRSAIPAGSSVHAVPYGIVVFDDVSGSLWSRGIGELSGLADLGAEPPDHLVPGQAVVGTSGTVAIVTEGSVIWPYSGDEGEPKNWLLPEGFTPEHLTMAGSRLVLVDGTRWLIGSQSGSRFFEGPLVSSIGAPTSDTNLVGFIDQDGTVGLTQLSSDDSIVLSMVGEANTQPVLMAECVFVLSGPSGEVRYTVTCKDGRNTDFGELDIGVDAQLREVNGFVWVDALDGSGFVVSPELEISEIADFSEVFDDSDGEESSDGENVKEVLDQTAEDAGLTDADERTSNEENEPPVAVDDEAATRVGRPVLVDVLYNDSDPDADVILVDSAEVISGDAIVEVPTSRNGVQITPNGAAGEVTVRYRISDGNPGGEASAIITLDVLAYTQDNNRPPEAGLDRAVGAAGSVVSLNLLVNDTDPDGDSIVLVSVSPEEGSGVTVLSVHPGGDVLVALPATVSAGTITIPYMVEDEWREPADGLIQLEMRIEGSNTPPDARNDAGVTQVGRAISMNLLENDADSDNDLLSIGQPATYLGEGTAGGLVITNEDGQFFFEPSKAGTFVFEYSATDSIGSDLAIVRIEVTEPTQNRPPIAIRDDVTLALGETRLVRALENDGDADGDLFAVVDFTGSEHLKVVEEPGVGFWVSMKPSAKPVEPFWYRISDGHAESELVMVVVARSDVSFQDAAPIANDDVARVRPGRSSWINVLHNDYDPEGGTLTITQVESTDEAMVPAIGGQGQNVTVKVPLGSELPFALTYVITDAVGNVATANVQVAIVPEDEPNAAPVARPDSAYTIEEQSVLVPVLANDSDPESDAFEVVAVPRSPTGGIAELSEDKKSFLYTPSPGFTGTDQFTYLLRDSEGGESTGFVAVGVMPKPHENTAPVANPDLEYVFSAGAGEMKLDVLDNDIDADDDPLTIIAATGTATIAANGKSVLFPIPVSVDGQQVLGFSYEISDGRGGTDEADVLVTVLAVEIDPVPPVANPDSYGPVKAPGDQRIELSIDVANNDEDPDGDPALLVVSTTEPGASVVNNRLVVMTPAESREFGYTITDPDGLSDSSFVTVSVEPNLAPVIQSPIHLGEFFTDEQIPTQNLAEYVTDPDGDELVFSGVSSQVGGTTRLDVNAGDARTVTFLPSEDFKGEAGFAFTVEDGFGHTVTGRISLTLKGLSNEPPVGQDALISLEAGVAQPVSFSGMFTDPDVGDTLTYEMVSQPGDPVFVEAEGPDSIRINTEITATAAETSFVVRATDVEGETAEATVTVRVTESLIGPPEANPDSAETNQEQAVPVDVLSNDINTLGTGALEIIHAFSAEGSTSISGSEITFTPTNGFFGTATVQYTISDSRQRADGEAIGILTVSVVGRPSAPVGLSATPLPPRSIGFAWLSPPNNGAPIERYEVEVDGTVTSIGTTPSHNFNSLEPGPDHSFRVRAINKAGEGEWSSIIVESVDEVPGAPGRPAAAISPNSGELQVSWATPPNDGSTISGYNLQISQCASQVVTGIGGTDYVWTGLTNGTRCAFSVTATNQKGDSPASPLSNLECPVGVPLAPGQPVAVRGDKEADVSWNQPENPDCEALLGFEIVRSPAQTTPVPAGTLNWVSGSLTNGESYSYQVRAENRAGWSDLSPSSDVIVPCGVPLAPSAPSAVRGDTLVTLTHSSDADANGCAVSQYEVSYNGGGWNQFPANGVVPGLTNGTEYTFQIRAINEIGEGEASPVSNAVIPAGPPLVAPSLGFGISRSLNHYWAVGDVDSNGSELLVYHASGNVSEDPHDRGRGGLASGGLGSTCTISVRVWCLSGGGPGATPRPPDVCDQVRQTVSATVWASNEIGIGPSRSGSETIAGCPAAPTLDMPVSDGDGFFRVTWDRPQYTQSMYIQINNNFGSAITGSTLTSTGLQNGQDYWVTAWACNSLGCSKSTPLLASPEAPDPTVSISRGSNATGQPGCTSADCARFSVSFADLAPNTNVSLICYESNGTRLYNGNQSVNTGSGSETVMSHCYADPAAWGGVYITLGGVRSNTANW